jgi:uncharacterized short protein YbdD (DUF466 family)
MRPLSTTATPVKAANAAPGGNAPGMRMSYLLRTLRGAYLQMFGIPDYERYVGHMTSHHPGEPPLSRREFFARAIDRKYCRSGPRCC